MIAAAHNVGTARQHPAVTGVPPMTLADIMTFPVTTVPADYPVHWALTTMRGQRISALVVVDEDGYLEGVITRTDLVRAAHERRDWGQQPAQDWMMRNVVTVGLEDTLEKVMGLLIDNHIHRVVAVENENGKLRPVAVLSAADVVYHMAQLR